MLHVENAHVAIQPVGSIEGQPSTGPFFVKSLMLGESMALLEVRVACGVASALHTHSHESLVYVVSGILSTTIGAETFVLAPGDVCRHPSGVSHVVKALQECGFQI